MASRELQRRWARQMILASGDPVTLAWEKLPAIIAHALLSSERSSELPGHVLDGLAVAAYGNRWTVSDVQTQVMLAAAWGPRYVVPSPFGKPKQPQGRTFDLLDDAIHYNFMPPPLAKGPSRTDAESLDRYEASIRRAICRQVRHAPHSGLARAVRRRLNQERAQRASTLLPVAKRSQPPARPVLRRAPRRTRTRRIVRRGAQLRSTADPPPGPGEDAAVPVESSPLPLAVSSVANGGTP